MDPSPSPPPPSATDEAAPASAGERAKKRRTVRIPDDEVARPSRPPPPVAPAPVSQPIMGQRIISIGGPPPEPKPVEPTVEAPAPPRPASQPPRPASQPPRPASQPPRPLAAKADPDSVTDPALASPRSHAPSTEREPLTEPHLPSEDDSWTPYQPVVEASAQAIDATKPLLSPLVAAPAAPVLQAEPPPASQRRPSVQFEAPPVWARPPVRPEVEVHAAAPGEMRARVPSSPGDYRARAPSSPGAYRASSPSHSESFHTPEVRRGSSPEVLRRSPSVPDLQAVVPPTPSVVDLATPPPGAPWGPPRDSIVDVAVDFESDVTLLDVNSAASATDLHSRATRLDDRELEGELPKDYVSAERLSSSNLESLDADSGASMEIEAAPPSIDEVDVEPDSDSRPNYSAAAEITTEVADDEIEESAHAPPPPPKVGEKGAPPAPKLAPPNALGLGNLAPAPLTDASALRKKGRPWWEELFNDDFVRTHHKTSEAAYKAEVDFIEDSLAMEKGATLLDLACGTGRHAIELSKRGYRMVGYDLSLAMLARAADHAQAEDQRINFVQGDMREMQFEEAFDGVYCWNTSFGYFEEDKNAHVLGLVHRALRKGGQLLLDVVNRDYIIQQSPTTAWFEGDACICMDEMQVDWITSRMRVKRTIMFDDGRSRELEYSVRLYSLHELGRLLHEQGFRVAEVSGMLSTPGVYFGCQSPRTLILAEKR